MGGQSQPPTPIYIIFIFVEYSYVMDATTHWQVMDSYVMYEADYPGPVPGPAWDNSIGSCWLVVPEHWQVLLANCVKSWLLWESKSFDNAAVILKRIEQLLCARLLTPTY